jgi:hypothetical protein
MTSPATLEARTHVALVHHPVLDRSGRIVTTAVTNLDIHDIARATRSFGLRRYHLVTPVDAQRELVARILAHWSDGQGREHNDKRSDALEKVSVAASLGEVVERIGSEAGRPPFLAVTGARPRDGVIPFGSLAPRVEEGRPLLLVFGTGWGLAEEVFARADAVLAPIGGRAVDGYNHLSVRSAVAIVLDRLFGDR